MIERTVYQCEHCKKHKRTPKIYFKKSDTYFHEQACLYNEKNKSCFTCVHNTRNKRKDYWDSRARLGCGFDLIDWGKDVSLSDTVEKFCDHWEYEFQVDESEVSE